MEKQKEIIITERGVYKKVNDNGRIIIPHHKRAENKNENEVVVDGLGRIQLARKILGKLGIRSGDKLGIYISGRNIILKKMNPKVIESKTTKMYINNKYEVKIEINSVDFSTKHKITTVDELSRILIWHEIREELGIIESDTLKVCVKDNMIILIPKRKC